MVKLQGPKASLRREYAESMPFSFKVDLWDGGTVDQKASNRCWIIASMNPLRREAMRRLSIADGNFLLSSGYIAFYDQLERSEMFLDKVISTRDKDVDDIAYLLCMPVPDTGQWYRFSYLAEKYGVVPQECMEETFNFSEPALCNRLLSEYLRKCAWILREECGDDELEERKAEALSVIRSYLVKNYGEPPLTVDFRYKDTSGNERHIEKMTPRDFYRTCCGAHPEDYVFLINHPSAKYPYLRTYTDREDLTRGFDTMLNVDIGTMGRLVRRQLDAGEMVVFGSDTRQQNDGRYGVMDASLYDYEGVLGLDLSMPKEQRVRYHNIQGTHIMTFTGYGEGRWKVLNSRGGDFGHNGFYVMTDSWFREYVLSAVIRKDLMDDYLIEAWEKEPSYMPKGARYL